MERVRLGIAGPGTKIIAVNAGPRKGWNTDTLIIATESGIKTYQFE